MGKAVGVGEALVAMTGAAAGVMVASAITVGAPEAGRLM